MFKTILDTFSWRGLRRIQINTAGWTRVILILIVTLLLTVSLLRVLLNAIRTDEVYRYELSVKDELADINAERKAELEFQRSPEYAKLHARDYLHLAIPGEKLYLIPSVQERKITIAQSTYIVEQELYPQLWQLILLPQF